MYDRGEDDGRKLKCSYLCMRDRGEDDDSLLSVNCLRITFDEELQLLLYRHWSLFNSLCHSINTACKFKVWTLKGQQRLHEFLAEMG